MKRMSLVTLLRENFTDAVLKVQEKMYITLYQRKNTINNITIISDNGFAMMLNPSIVGI